MAEKSTNIVNEWMFKFLIWRLKHISDRNFVLIMGSIIGILSGFAAVLLKICVHYFQHLLTSGVDIKYVNYFYLGFPMVGIVITVFLANYILKENLGHGITQILYDISKRNGIIHRAKMYSRMLTSAITVGFGGSVGLEAPIVVTGSAIGSNVSQLVHMDQKKRSIMIGCGAAAAISAIFNSPIAGVIFCMEVILADVRISTFIPLLISSVCGSLVSLMLLGDDVLFSFQLKEQFVSSDVPYYILLGITCGLVSVYFTRLTYKIESAVRKIKNVMGRGVFGGVTLGVIIFLFPPIYGEGYNTIKLLLNNNSSETLHNSLFFENFTNIPVIIIFLLGVLLIKPIASALTIGSGGSGGIFAPSLFIGGLAGFVFASSVNQIMGSPIISESNFTLVGMCGAMSGILHAPLTAIFLIAEITSGYGLFVPLMLVSAIAFSTSSFFEKSSLYTKNLIEKGDLIQYDKDRQVLSMINLDKIVERDLLTIVPEATLGELTRLVKKSKRNIFPVVNENRELVGIVTLDDIREIMFDKASQ
ncbi:MAG: chloride channel protein, partial [Cyclobacteriaceae bacterium]|nr:chloride channel protein [Cyclobacteriaceae bacterium]